MESGRIPEASVEARPAADFGGVEVVAFETRNAREAASLIARHGGAPRIAPSVEEVPLEDHSAAFEFAERLLAGRFDAVVLMTGVGVTTLVGAIEKRHARAAIVSALARTAVIARGSKTVRALKTLGLNRIIAAPEPNTWREVLNALDSLPNKATRVAVQEYGAANNEFLAELVRRGADVFRVPVYRWTLPRDSAPLEEALRAITGGQARVVIFTNAVQVEHVWQVAAGMGLSLESPLKRCVVCSIGPSCSEALRRHGIAADVEPEHHRMGILVHEAAQRSGALLREKDESDSIPHFRARRGGFTPSSGLQDKPAATFVAETGTSPSPARPAWYDSRFMRACRREPVDATPVWLMRQAGRYLREYRELRARIPFLGLCKSPDRVAEITVTAAERIGADAAILFADLLLVAEPMGFSVDYEKGAGPRVTPALRSAAEIGRLPAVARDSLAYVFEAVRRTRASLPSRLPLIGFSGAPFTLASYLIEGGA
ncbi:MAG: uroporphyrinogen decarboxylase family protein, partial [Terriglobia bacterium]